MRTYRHDVGPLTYASPGVILLILGGAALSLAGMLALGFRGLASAASVPIVGAVGHMMGQAAAVALGAGVVALISAAAVRFWMPDCAKIRYKVRRALWHPSFGNPLHLQEGERLPSVRALALKLGVNPNTVDRAYGELEARGLIRTIPKQGVFVCAGGGESALKEEARRQFAALRDAGLGEEDARAVLEEVYASREERT